MKRLLPLLLLILGLGLFLGFDVGRHFEPATLRIWQADLHHWVAAHPLAAPVAYILLYMLLAAFSLPVATIVTVTGGFLFGPWAAGLWTVIGATAGATLAFLAARYAFDSGRDYRLGSRLRGTAGTRLQRLEQELRTNAFHYLLFLRLVPVFPFWLVNIAPAAVTVPVRVFVAATALGILPGTFVFAYFGHSLGATLERSETLSLWQIASPETLIALTLLALLALLPVWLKRRQSKDGQE